MSTRNSYAEFILGTFQALLVDCACWYPELAREFTRDYQRLSSAIDGHGIRFALDTMPSFRKHFDKCLAEKRLTPSNLLHFGVGKKGEAIPRLFRGLTLRVFDRNGQLKDQVDPHAVRWLRQLLGVVRKLRLPCGVKDSGNAVRDFYRTDLGVRRGSLSWDNHVAFSGESEANGTSFTDAAGPPALVDDLFLGRTPSPGRDFISLLDMVQRVADLVSSSLGVFNPHAWSLRHGPGAVADQVVGTDKYQFPHWSVRLEDSFPLADFAYANYACVELESVESARSRGFTLLEPPARLCAVPKTIKTPRLIACEPVSLQWCQQALRDYFYRRVSQTVFSQFVDFRRQDKNGSLALRASLDGAHSTIDLSSASDRISCWHVERLFRRSPALLRALQATRSVWLRQDICRYSPQYHYLRKYSTMGNATTFPVQSLFFMVLSIACVLHTRGLKVTLKNVKELGESQVRVFGDDIIVPSDVSGLLVGLLESLELRVNIHKTFTVGNFRESCGVDAFQGHDVTSVSILELPRRASPGSIASSVDVHNNLHNAGYDNTAAHVRQTASRAGFERIREVKDGEGAFGWATYGPPDLSALKHRVNGALQRREVKCLQPIAVSTRHPAEGVAGLLQFFTEAAKKVTSASSTLGYLDQRPKNKLTLRWVPV